LQRNCPATSLGLLIVIIGTAGHIDTGNTALVNALTRDDSTGWRRKSAGITIDLGFSQEFAV